MARRAGVKQLRVKEFCNARGWTVDDIARYSWMKYPAVRNLFHGVTLDASLITLIPIAHALGVTVEELVVLDGEQPIEVDLSQRTPKRLGPLEFVRTQVKDLCEVKDWDADTLARVSELNFNTIRSLFYRPTSAPIVSTAIPVARALETQVEKLVIFNLEEELLDPKRMPLGNLQKQAA